MRGMVLKFLFRTLLICVLFVSFFIMVLPIQANAAVTVIHGFDGAADDGEYPCELSCTLLEIDSYLYGVTGYGGAHGDGVVFKINKDGTGFSLVHSFNSGADEGSYPNGGLVNAGSVLYGSAVNGGTNSNGTLYSVNTDGSNFTVLRNFAGGGSDGAAPYGTMVLSGSKLYGMTYDGGDADMGTIYSMNTDGTGFALLHEFTGGGSGGDSSYGSLTLSGSKLYGMTQYGGDADYGTIFSINTDGSGFTLLHEFAGGGSDGASPYGSLTLLNTKLYGMTQSGGDEDAGVIFSMNTDGSGYSLLHEFGSGASNGLAPWDSLTAYNGALYGVTAGGGGNGQGILFSINTDGAEFTVLHSFAAFPYTGGVAGDTYGGTPLITGGKLFNMSYSGGGSGVSGTLYYYQLPEEPTPTPTPGGSSTDFSSPRPEGEFSTTEAPSCKDATPIGAPSLYQIDRVGDKATLHFTPVSGSVSYYFISYGEDARAEGYSGEYGYSKPDGAISETINFLKSNTPYYFKVRAGNGCMPGDWSQVVRK